MQDPLPSRLLEGKQLHKLVRQLEGLRLVSRNGTRGRKRSTSAERLMSLQQIEVPACMKLDQVGTCQPGSEEHACSNSRCHYRCHFALCSSLCSGCHVRIQQNLRTLACTHVTS